jgi:DNA uptake protein ComE-like DNA-binding protein
MKRTLLLALGLLFLAGCSSANRSPDAIRQQTASATATAARDAKAVAQGVAQGLKEKGPININKASEDDLASLPGIDHATARRIVAGRPYGDSDDLVKRHVVSKSEYDRIADHITAH